MPPEPDPKKIFVTRPLPGPAVNDLKAAFGQDAVEVFPGAEPIPRALFLERIHGADALLCLLTERIDDEALDAAGPQLKIVANMAVGYDNIDVAAATARGIPVTNTPGVLTETTADLAWTLILAASRRTGEAERYVRNGDWRYWSPTLLLGHDIHGKTLGIFGMGRIGQAVARRAVGFGMRVIYHNRNRLEAETEKTLNAEYVDRDTLLRTSDIVSAHCPLTDETRHTFAAEAFAAMKPSAVFINTTRGPVVDEPALAEALKTGAIFAAGLDVFENEPAVHPALLERENAVLLPHIGSATDETRSAMAQIAADNIIACLQGNLPNACINPAVLG